MAIVTLRYWAAAKDAAGVAEEKVRAQTLAAALAAGLTAVRERDQPERDQPERDQPERDQPERDQPERDQSGPGQSGGSDRAGRFRLVLARSSFLVNGEPAGTRPAESIALHDDDVIEVLPPFAGG